jgi:hypothetical protein
VSVDALFSGIDEDSPFPEASRRALLELSNEQRATAGSFFGAVAAKPNAMGEDFLDAIARARATLSNDLMYRCMLDRMLIGAPKVENLPTAQASTAIRQWAQRIELFFGGPFGRGAAKAPALPLPACEFTWSDDTELNRRVKAFSERVPDYYAVMNRCSWRVPEYVQAYFRASLNAPEVAYYLGQHKEIYDAIAAAQPIGAVARLLSLERELAEWRYRMTPESLYSTPLPASPTPEECTAAQRLLHLVTWADREVGTAN